MNASQFAKAQKLFDRVKELDAEILEIEKLAQLIAEKKTEIKLSLQIKDTEKKHTEKVLDNDGSLIYGRSPLYNPFQITLRMFGEEPKKEDKDGYDVKHTASIPDQVALQVLGVLLADKMEARTLALKRLNTMGIDI